MAIPCLAFLFVLVTVLSSGLCFRLPDSIEDISCKTVGNEDGKCIKITECKTFADFLVKQLDTQTSYLFRKSHCGFEADMPKVCCPNEEVDIKASDQETRETKELTSEIDASDFDLRDGGSSEGTDCTGKDCIASEIAVHSDIP
eukprot:GFUD01007129.1.p1 GENE.GFUD01007129.1~~GFUD01007129.1.p1  ORF type:complete len:144 (+),score=19.90 GFUD01007129.1:108-539(+)